MENADAAHFPIWQRPGAVQTPARLWQHGQLQEMLHQAIDRVAATFLTARGEDQPPPHELEWPSTIVENDSPRCSRNVDDIDAPEKFRRVEGKFFSPLYSLEQVQRGDRVRDSNIMDSDQLVCRKNRVNLLGDCFINGTIPLGKGPRPLLELMPRR